MFSDDFLPAATGVGSHVQSIAAALVKRGHTIDVITSRPRATPETQEWRGVTVHRMPTVRVFGFYQAVPSASRLRALLAELAPDIVHHHYLGLMLMRTMEVAEQLALPEIYTYHMTEDHLTQPLPLRPLRGFFASQIRRCCDQVDEVISVSRNLADKLRAGGIRTPIRFISNPVDFDDDKLTAATGGPGLKLLFVGRLNPEKNVSLLLRAFAGLLKHDLQAELWIAGHGSERAELERQARSLHIDERTRFLGFLDHATLAPYYAGCDVFVLPSFVETQGLVALEAMHFGKPLIVSRAIVSATELVEEGVNGFLVDARDPEELTARLVMLARDPEARLRLGNSGRLRANSFRPDDVVEALESTYREVLARRDREPVSISHRWSSPRG
jgi:glycosyltransferase involved in cell wall biosynthesis